jgi:hypothetical protein
MKIEITYSVSQRHPKCFDWVVFENGRNVGQDNKRSLRGALAMAERCAERRAAERRHFKTNDVTVTKSQLSL